MFIVSQMSNELILLNNRIELNELTLMTLTVVNQFGKFLSHGLDVVKPGERHIAVKVGCGRAWVNREDFHGGVTLLELDSHNAHHSVLGRFAGHIGQRMPVGTDL